ncbi:MAG: prepilin-type N-terminal cleavage/methylation domain-containing protein [Planctomycetes bacterium]|nr:prepilin-type N-terminal cleavage/methylation domain-containing protein [Planctomycetota bacterium]
MTTCDRQSGFTLLEVIVVLGVLGVLLGTAVPLAGAVVEADRRQEVTAELAQLGEALDSYYYANAAFPPSLTDAAFLGVHLQPGPRGTAVRDAFADRDYAYSVSGGVATVYSVGENGLDDGVNNEEWVVRVHSSVAGTRRTWQRLRLCVELLAEHIEAGGSVAGAWPSLRASLGLGATFDFDGWGTTLQWTAATHTLSSAGPDRTFGTADDITI